MATFCLVRPYLYILVYPGTHPYHKYVTNTISWSSSTAGADFYASTLEMACCLLNPSEPLLVLDTVDLSPLIEDINMGSFEVSHYLEINLFISAYDAYPVCPTSILKTDRSIQTGEDCLSDNSPLLNDNLLSTRSALSDVVVLKHILMLLGVSDGLACRLVSHLWCTVASQYTHRTVYFWLPGDWQWGLIDHNIVALWVAVYELVFLLFLTRWGVAHTMCRVMQINWIYQSTCFF